MKISELVRFFVTYTHVMFGLLEMPIFWKPKGKFYVKPSPS